MARINNIPWFEWIYQVDEIWVVTNIKTGKRIKPTICNWYEKVRLYKSWKEKKYYVHRLVYCIFNWIDLKFNWYKWNNIVRHKDDNPSNNKLSNLEIGTQKDNIGDCIKRWRFASWEKHWWHKLKESQIKRIKLMLEIWTLTQIKISKFFWVWPDIISRIKSWIYWKHIL